MPDPTTLVAFAEQRRDALATSLAAARQKAAGAQARLQGEPGSSADLAARRQALDAKEQALAERQAELAALPASAPAAERTRLTAAVDDLKREIQGLQRQIGAGSLLAHRIQRLAALESRAEQIRKQIAQAPTGADADALADTLTSLTIEQVVASANLLAAERNLASAQADEELAQQQVQRYAGALAVADPLVTAEQERQVERQQLIQLLAQEPLSLVRDRAAAILAAANGMANGAGGDDEWSRAAAAATQAKERIESDVPADLRGDLITRATEKLDDLVARRTALAHAETGLAEHRAQTQGAAAAVAASRARFDQADAELVAYVRQSPLLLQLAGGLLSGIGASPPLTGPQKAALQNTSLPPNRRKAAVPRHIWSNLIQFLEAKRLLTGLAQQRDLVAGRQTAEQQLVAEMVKEAAAATGLDERLDAVAEKRQAAALADSSGQRLVLEALRGEP